MGGDRRGRVGGRRRGGGRVTPPPLRSVDGGGAVRSVRRRRPPPHGGHTQLFKRCSLTYKPLGSGVPAAPRRSAATRATPKHKTHTRLTHTQSPGSPTLNRSRARTRAAGARRLPSTAAHQITRGRPAAQATPPPHRHGAALPTTRCPPAAHALSILDCGVANFWAPVTRGLPAPRASHAAAFFKVVVQRNEGYTFEIFTSDSRYGQFHRICSVSVRNLIAI